MTLKQMAIARFLRAVAEYKNALRILRDPFVTSTAKEGANLTIICASLVIHSTKGQVPRGYWKWSSWKSLTA